MVEMTAPTNVERVVGGLMAGVMRTTAVTKGVVMEELGMKGLVMGAVLTVVVEAAPHVMEVVVGAAAPPHALWQSAEAGAGAQVRRRRRRHRPSTGIV